MPAPAAPRRVPILAIVAVVVATIAILPSLLVLLVGLLPDMMTMLWYLIVTLPFTVGVGVIAAVLAVTALILDIRAQRTLVWSIVALALSVIAVFPASFLFGWWG